MTAIRRGAIVASLSIGALAWPATASAHPLGNFTINLGSRIEVSPGAVQLGYVVDMAEIPTQQAKADLDADGDGTPSRAELAAWAGDAARELVRHVSLSVNGSPVELATRCAVAREAPGQAGLPVLRLEAGYAGAIAGSGAIAYRDDNYAGHIGWHEVTAAGVDGVGLESSSVPVRSVSDELRAYPQDLLSSPLDVRAASFRYAPGASDAVASSPCSGVATPSGARPGVSGGAFADLVSRPDLGAWIVVLSLLLALGFGALHAIGPGHGKTLMAAYLVGSGGRPRQAVAVGAAVAVMHTASVLALGMLVLTLERTFPPERVYPWLGLGSGFVALGLGAALLVQRLGVWADARRDERDPSNAPQPAGHIHAEPGSAGHHDPVGDAGPGAHAHAVPDAPVLSRRGLMALAVAGGILPSPTALVVLLSAVSFHRVAFGLSLIAMFSIGLAAALIVVGIAALRARDVVSSRMSTRLGRLVPIASASLIVAVGLFLTVRGVAQL
jgi:nickel/cobalt transporter (NicO) family protein